ncbi:DUF6603 domain-containing protein [Streptomyces lushanensis]|uniref:DUF6603 domain-containing protein n=1 Tax=Streptomyces lushanensis TaxID=1434255 RepID=UPI00082D88EE|nr:DUF6603 domain-containing protein [Streptomyces lushanensis]
MQLDRSLAEAVTDVIRPVSAAAESPAAAAQLVDLLGWEPTVVEGLPEAATAAFTAGRTALREMAGLLRKPQLELDDLREAFGLAQRAFTGIRSALSRWHPPAGLPADLAETFLEDLLNGLFDRWLLAQLPRPAAVLTLLGVRTVSMGTAILTADGRTVRRAVPRPRLDLGRLRRALTEPLAVIKEAALAGGDSAAEIGDTLGPLLESVARDAGLTAGYRIPGAATDPVLTDRQKQAAHRLLRVSLDGRPDTAGTDPEPGPPVTADLAVLAGLADGPAGTAAVLLLEGALNGRWAWGDWTVSASSRGDVPPIVIEADRVRFEGEDPGGIVARLTAVGRAPSGPLWRLGPPTGTRVEIDGIDAALSVSLSTGQRPVLAAEAALRGLRMVLGEVDDPFLARVLPEGPLTVQLDAGVEFTPEHGLRMSASGALEYRFPVGVELGPVTIPAGLARIALTEDGIALDLTGDLTLALGPLVVSAADIGIQLAAGSAQDQGSFGPVDVRAGFKPPTGLGLKVEAGPLAGAGQLSIDRAKGRYSGAAQLRMALGGRDIELAALGLIDTRDASGTPLRGADGADAWSLLLVASAAWTPGFQIGMGFALSGLGALVGVHRAADPAALRAAVRTRALDAVLFARTGTDPSLPETLGRLFPVAHGRYLAGLMARITWGATGGGPSPVTADLALFAEFPDPIRIGLLGRITVVLPTPEAAVVQLRMDSVGLLDFGTGSASLDATLVDSKVAGFTVTGDMAMRIQWGSRRRFLLSVGGFHPRYADRPHDVPRLARVAMSLAEGDNPRLRAESYLAVTSNTIQHGARVELRAGAAGFTIEGELGYDALIQFDPFGFEIDIHARVAVKRGRRVILAIGVELHLSGPNPWHARGRATFKLLFISVTVKFDVTSGRRAPGSLPRTLDVWQRLRAAFADPGCWHTLPPARPTGVLVREAPRSAGGIPLHPLGELAVSQRLLPLGMEIGRIGGSPADRRRTYDLTGFTCGRGGDTRPGELGEALYEDFADGEYTDLTDDQRLSRPSFTRRRAGHRLAVGQLRHPHGNGDGGVPHTTFTTVDYEVIGGGPAAGAVGLTADAPRRETSDARTNFALAGFGPAGRAASRAARFTAVGPRTTMTKVAR